MASPKRSKDISLAQFRPAQGGDVPFEIHRVESMGPRFFSNQPTRHTFYVTLWLEEGKGLYFIDFQGHAVKPHTLYFVMPGQVHAWQIEQAVRGYVLFFTEEFLSVGRSETNLLHQLDIFHGVDHAPVLPVVKEKIKMVDVLIQTMMSEYKNSQAGRALALQALLQLLLIEAQRQHDLRQKTKQTAVPSSGDVLSKKFRELVTEHFLTLRTVEDYAEKLHVNAHHLSDMVKQVTGLPPGAHLRQRLILEAKRLLAHTDNTVQHIAYELGFEDPAYFGRFFKREAGSSPNVFRKSVREKYQNI
jgi:AraC family transcriptional regulator, transcriptional activator of pobA